MPTLRELFGTITPDEWRTTTPFSSDIQSAAERLLAANSDDERHVELLAWIAKNQPCLFGKAAAKLDLITTCFITEAELGTLSDVQIKDKIQSARREFYRGAFKGSKSGFILHVVSPVLANALPDKNLCELARHLCQLYLRTEIEIDKIHLEDVFLSAPSLEEPRSWKWPGGVNYFAANGDGRWWHDHRIPCGIAFSVNSVGQMVKSRRLHDALQVLKSLTGEEVEHTANIDSLAKALQLAMQTIDNASETTSGKATYLVPKISDPALGQLPKCPITLPPKIAPMNHCAYEGYYHTDITLPREFFIPNVVRPDGIDPIELDFTYLFHDDLNNPAYETMGEGVPIRSSESVINVKQRNRIYKTEPSQRPVSDFPLLSMALGLNQ